jgi:hypothetical protein
VKKSLRALEAVSSTSLMLSKYFLAIGSIYGWLLSILGYVLTAFFNIKIKLKIAAIIVSVFAVISAYGFYKWSFEINGLQIIDYLIIILGSIFSTIMIISEAKKKKPLWFLQSIATVLFTIAFISLGMKMEIGWYALLLGHINNTFMYYKKNAYILSLMQIISIIIVLCKILK